MRAMFLMMNEARLLVGLQGFTCASNAYVNAVNYARERKQGKNLLQAMNENAEAVAIIQHPDVRRQLIHMKALVEGMRSLLYYMGMCSDQVNIAKDEAEKDKYQGLIEILTPVAKGYVTDRAFEVCSQGVQVYGGYGYIREYPMEQLMRDCRITMIYEGTNGIQAMDLLGRKLGMKKGKPIMDLLGEIQKTIAAAKVIPALQDYAVQVEKAVNKLGEVAMHLGATAMSPNVMSAFAFAHPFLDVTGDVMMAWMLLWRAAIAATQMEKLAGSLGAEARSKAVEKNKNAAFYEGQIRSAEYFIYSILPVTWGKMKAITTTNSAAVDIPEAAFGA
jgi:hypothetical protein